MYEVRTLRTSYVFFYFLRTSYIVHRTSYIRKYADTFEVRTLRTSYVFFYFLRTSYIVHRTSYIRKYADTFIVIYFFKDNQFLLFIELICRTCKCKFLHTLVVF